MEVQILSPALKLLGDGNRVGIPVCNHFSTNQEDDRPLVEDRNQGQYSDHQSDGYLPVVRGPIRLPPGIARRVVPGT